MPILSNFPVGKTIKYNSSLMSDATDEAATPSAIKQTNERIRANAGTWGSVLMASVGFAGDGTKANPYRIYTAEQLNAIRYMPNSYYKLMCNLEIDRNTVWSPIGTGEAPFTGTFDGNGCTITLKYVVGTGNAIGSSTTSGLFGYCNRAAIKNLQLNFLPLTSHSTVGTTKLDYAGGIAGRILATTIEKCHVRGGNYFAKTAGGYAGGLIGFAQASDIYDSYVESFGTISADSAGGLVGGAYQGTKILRTYTRSGTIHAASYGGAIIGQANSSATDQTNFAYNHTVTNLAATASNRMVGNQDALIDTNTILTLPQARKAENYPEWDFENVWQQDVGYPSLRYTYTL